MNLYQHPGDADRLLRVEQAEFGNEVEGRVGLAWEVVNWPDVVARYAAATANG